MVKRMIIFLMLLLIFMPTILSVNADKIEKNNIFIDPYDDVSEYLMFAKKDEKVEGKVTSDIPINLYIITSDNYISGSSSKDYSKAVYSKEGVTSQSFSYKISDDQTYYLIIYNPNNATATVNYEYTNFFEERMEEAGQFLGMGIAICAGVIIIFFVIIILIIYFLTRKKTPPQQPYGQYPQYQQYPGYPPQQGYQQPQPPGQPPQQPPKK